MGNDKTSTSDQNPPKGGESTTPSAEPRRNFMTEISAVVIGGFADSPPFAGTGCAFIAIEQLNKRIKVSFRSRTNLDMAAVAERFGGGGHKQAAGAVLPGDLAAAKTKLLAAIQEVVAG